MNLKIVMLLGLLSNGLIFADDFEDDWIKFIRESSKAESKPQHKKPATDTQSKKNNRARATRPLHKKTPPKKPLKKLDYKELYDNFEQYETLTSLEGFEVDREALIKRASEEIELFESVENEDYDELVRYGTATLACFLLLCGPWVPVSPLNKIPDDLKTLMSGLGLVGCAVLSGGTGAKAYEYMHSEQSLKARHSAIKKWLLKVH